MFIICIEEDYADEFDYPVISLFTEKEKKEALKHLKDNPFDEQEFYFGTNEWLELSSKNIIEWIEEAKEISDEEIETLEKFNILPYMGLNIIERVLESI